MPDIKNNKLLIAGGSGFIGSRVAVAAREAGANVAVVDRMPFPQALSEGVRGHVVELTDAAALDVIFEKEQPELVLDFAFDVSDYAAGTVSADGMRGLNNMLEACRSYAIKKYLFASSGAVYGNAKRIPTPESEPLNPNSPYGELKSAMESRVRSAGIPYVIMRYATVYGPGQVKGAMADYIRELSSGRQADIFGDGKKTSDYVYIDDAVAATLLAIRLDDPDSNPVFNVGTARETAIGDVYAAIARHLGKPPNPRYLPSRRGELARYCLDYGKINRLTGWEPKYHPEEGLEKRLREERLL